MKVSITTRSNYKSILLVCSLVDTLYVYIGIEKINTKLLGHFLIKSLHIWLDAQE